MFEMLRLRSSRSANNYPHTQNVCGQAGALVVAGNLFACMNNI